MNADDDAGKEDSVTKATGKKKKILISLCIAVILFSIILVYMTTQSSWGCHWGWAGEHCHDLCMLTAEPHCAGLWGETTHMH